MAAQQQPLDFSAAMHRRIRIHRNFVTGTMSAQWYVAEKKGWRVAGHFENCVLFDVEFIVDYAKLRYIRNKKKRRDVFAVAEGWLVAQEDESLIATVEVSINPFGMGERFYQQGTGAFVYPCSYVVVWNCVTFASDDALIVGQKQPIYQPQNLN